ncbi:MAG: ABC transporter substrate-binding protein [Lachnospiraceae bacterium]|nr:ABC transporter substrate-binding protein [Lachnospiraceae bacterium]
MKKLISLTLAAMMAAMSLTACSQGTSSTDTGASTSSESSAEETENTESTSASDASGTAYIVAASNSDCVTFAPWGQQGGGRKAVRRALYETLVYLNADGSVSYDLAKDIEEVSEGVYDVTIYDYIVDTAGNPMTASDVIFSFDKANETGLYAAYLQGVSYTEIDDYTVRFTFEDEKIGGLYTMLDAVYIVTEAAYEQSGDGMALNPIGTTSYVLEDYVSGASIKFKKVDTYWQTEDLTIDALQANLDGFEWVIITEKSQHSIALESGDIDCTNSLLAADYVNFINDDGTTKDGYDYVESVHTGMLAISFNCSDESLCSDVNLRKAIAYAIDTAAMVYAGYGSAGVAADCFSSPVYKDYDSSWEEDDYFAQNLELAKSYLEKSDYAGEELVLLCQSDTEVTSQATLIQSYCEQLGITLKMEYYDSNLYQTYRDDFTYFYDINLEYINATNYTYELLSFLTDYTYENGTSRLRISDATLTELYDLASSAQTSSAETVQNMFDYINDNCYAFAVGYYTQKVFYDSNLISELGVTADYFNPTPYTSVLN